MVSLDPSVNIKILIPIPTLSHDCIYYGNVCQPLALSFNATTSTSIPHPHAADIPPQVPVWDKAIEDCSMKPILFIMPLSNLLSTNVASREY